MSKDAIAVLVMVVFYGTAGLAIGLYLRRLFSANSRAMLAEKNTSPEKKLKGCLGTVAVIVVAGIAGAIGRGCAQEAAKASRTPTLQFQTAKHLR